MKLKVRAGQAQLETGRVTLWSSLHHFHLALYTSFSIKIVSSAGCLFLCPPPTPNMAVHGCPAAPVYISHLSSGHSSIHSRCPEGAVRFVTRVLCPACLFLEKKTKQKTKLAAELIGTPPDGRRVIPVTDIWVVSTCGQKIQGRERASSRPPEYS